VLTHLRPIRSVYFSVLPNNFLRCLFHGRRSSPLVWSSYSFHRCSYPQDHRLAYCDVRSCWHPSECFTKSTKLRQGVGEFSLSRATVLMKRRFQPPRYNIDAWDEMMMDRDRRLTGHPRGQTVCSLLGPHGQYHAHERLTVGYKGASRL
jgi:hypothetical protein